ncbi:MAG: pantoate--beta-alanine ligase [Acidaminococcales bacterium]|jgi:pantoate--beta-alanine ligase|nr:pantoate--beta-alanine ligase [Acidaminococcales bacterium]
MSMLLLKTVQEARAACREAKSRGGGVGLVPTMGALHAGHASLIEAAARENDFVVVSVFVNPTQFAPTEDLDAYPRSLDKDCALAEQMGAQAVFAPTAAQMYPGGEGVWVKVAGRLTEILCGRSRPAHFRGVTTVVAKLFNIIAPDRAYFGQKDGQQAQVIRRMAEELFVPTEIKIMPIVREADGLALSSRNVYLSGREREAALVLSRSLRAVREKIEKGERDPAAALSFLNGLIAAEPLARLEYAEIYSFPALEEFAGEMSGEVFIALAAKIGQTRLIDNIVVAAGPY